MSSPLPHQETDMECFVVNERANIVGKDDTGRELSADLLLRACTLSLFIAPDVAVLRIYIGKVSDFSSLWVDIGFTHPLILLLSQSMLPDYEIDLTSSGMSSLVRDMH